LSEDNQPVDASVLSALVAVHPTASTVNAR
jgi:hypothetical protein